MTDLDDALRSRRTAPGRHYVTTDLTARCPATYPRSASTPPNTRIVHCHLEAGHPGEHEEADTEVTWLPDDHERVREQALADPEVREAYLKARIDAAYERGLAEGRRQATEGWDREWGLHTNESGRITVKPRPDEASARRWATPGRTAVSRLVGPWEPAEQPEAFDMERFAQLSVSYADALEAFQHGDPARSAAALIATAVLLHQALGEFLNGVRRGHAEPASGGVVEPSGPLTAEEATPDCVLPPTLTVHLDNRDARFVPADPPVPYFEGDEALPPEPGTCPFCGKAHGWVDVTGFVANPGTATVEIARRQHDPGALIEKPDLYGKEAK